MTPRDRFAGPACPSADVALLGEEFANDGEAGEEGGCSPAASVGMARGLLLLGLPLLLVVTVSLPRVCCCQAHAGHEHTDEAQDNREVQ